MAHSPYFDSFLLTQIVPEDQPIQISSRDIPLEKQNLEQCGK